LKTSFVQLAKRFADFGSCKRRSGFAKENDFQELLEAAITYVE
jgi:hypothetical protein